MSVFGGTGFSFLQPPSASSSSQQTAQPQSVIHETAGKSGQKRFGNRSLVVSNSAPTNTTSTPFYGSTSLFTADNNVANRESNFSSGAATPLDEDELLELRQSRFTEKKVTGCLYDKLKDERPALKEWYIQQGKILPDNAQVSLDNAIAMVGECLDMCPEYERHERWFRDALFPFEKIPGTNDVDHTKAVKRYRRSASDNFTVLPCDVRPPHVLVKTLDYLFRDLLPQYPLLETHGFIRDRTRGIRNDFTIQNYRGMEAIECHERIARYHIMCTSQLVQSESFSVQQEQEQMRKTLQSLREYYADMKTAGIHCPNEPEFQAYYILSHIWQNETFTLAESLAPHIYNHPHVQLALRLQYLAQSATGSQERGFSHTRGGVNAYTEFFRTLQDSATPYLFAAILHMDFDLIRCNALMSMNKCLFDFEPHVSVVEIVDLLGLDDVSEAVSVLEYYGVAVDHNQMDENLSVALIGKTVSTVDGRTKVSSKPFHVKQRVNLVQRPSQRLVNSKIGNARLDEILDGSYLGPAGLVPKPHGYIARPNIGPLTPAANANIFPIKDRQESVTPTPSVKFVSDGGGLKFPNFPATKLAQMPPAASNGGFIETVKPAPALPQNMDKLTPAPVGIFGGIASKVSPFAPASQSSAQAPLISIPGLFSQGMAGFKQQQQEQKPIPTPLPLPQPPQLPQNLQPQILPQFNLPYQTKNSLFSPLSEKPPSPPQQQLHYQQHQQQEKQQVIPAFPQPTPSQTESKQPTKEELSLYETTLRSLLSEIAAESIHADRTMHRPFLDRLLTETIHETISEVHREIEHQFAQDRQRAANHYISKTQQRIFRDWFVRARALACERAAKEAKRQEKAVLFYKRVLAGGLEGGFLNSNGNSKSRKRRRQSDTKVSSIATTGALDFLKPSAAAVLEEQKGNSGFFHHLNLPQMVFPSLYSRNRAVIGSLGRDLVPRHLFWKLVVCTPAFRVQKAGRNGRIWSEGGFSLADRTASVWLCSKFGAGGDGSGRNRLYAAAVEETGENNCSVTELLRVSSEFPDPKPRAIGRAGASSKSSRCWLSVNVSHVSVEGEAIYPLKVNSEAVSSGTQAVLFQFRGFDCGSDVEDNDNDCVTDLERIWWEYERERLYSLLSTLPIGSKVPLLLAFVPTENMTVEQFKNRAGIELNLESILCENGGPVSAVDVISLGSTAFDHIAAMEALNDGIKWMAENSLLQPVMQFNILKDTFESQGIEAIRFAFNKIEESIPDPDFALDGNRHLETFNALVVIHNSQVNAITQILTAQENANITFPALELATAQTGQQPQIPPIIWNHPTTLERLSQVTAAFCLPPMSHAVDLENTSIAKVKQLKHMYEDYIVQLSKRKILDETLATAVLSDLWNYFAKFEQNFTITSSSSTTSIHSRQQRYDAFPFAKVGMCIVSSVVDALKTQLQICVKEMLNESKMTKPNHPFPEQSPWYDWTKVFPAMQEFETQVDAIVFGWEAEVLGPWKKVQETKREAEKEQQRKLQNDNKARMLNSAFDSPGSSMLSYSTPVRREKRPLVLSSSYPQGSYTFDYGTPIPRELLGEEDGSSVVSSPLSLSHLQPVYHQQQQQAHHHHQISNASSLTSAPLSAYALLKLRVQEALALSRLEIANSKKRLAQ